MLKGFIFYVKWLHINLTNGINQTTPAPGAGLGPIYDEAWENSVFICFTTWHLHAEGVWEAGLYGQRQSTSYNKIHLWLAIHLGLKTWTQTAHKEMLSGGRFLMLSRISVVLESQCDNCCVLPDFKHC